MEKIIIMKKVNYKYNEDKALSELKKYIDATYDDMVKVSVSATYSSMHNDMERKMVRTEVTC